SIFADEALPIVTVIGSRVIRLQKSLIALTLVAEDQAERRLKPGLVDQPVPIEMPDLVAKMTEQRSIGLAELAAAQLTLGIVGFRAAQRGEAVSVAGHH